MIINVETILLQESFDIFSTVYCIWKKHLKNTINAWLLLKDCEEEADLLTNSMFDHILKTKLWPFIQMFANQIWIKKKCIEQIMLSPPDDKNELHSIKNSRVPGQKTVSARWQKWASFY